MKIDKKITNLYNNKNKEISKLQIDHENRMERIKNDNATKKEYETKRYDMVKKRERDQKAKVKKSKAQIYFDSL